jgi:hypothetical protein
MLRRCSILVLTIATAAANLACEPGPLAPTGLRSASALIAALEQQGSTVTSMGEMPRDSYCLSVDALRLSVDGEDLYVFEYADSDAASRDASTVSPDGGAIGRCAFHWIGPPRFYRKDQLIALYVGTNADVIRRLDAVLGSPFARR